MFSSNITLCDCGSTNSSYGLIVAGDVILRYLHMGLLDSEIQPVYGIVRTAIWQDEECANGSYEPIRISTDGITRIAFLGDSARTVCIVSRSGA